VHANGCYVTLTNNCELHFVWRCDADIRYSLALCPEEKQFRSSRKKKVRDAMNKIMVGGPMSMREVSLAFLSSFQQIVCSVTSAWFLFPELIAADVQNIANELIPTGGWVRVDSLPQPIYSYCYQTEPNITCRLLDCAKKNFSDTKVTCGDGLRQSRASIEWLWLVLLRRWNWQPAVILLFLRPGPLHRHHGVRRRVPGGDRIFRRHKSPARHGNTAVCDLRSRSVWIVVVSVSSSFCDRS